MRYALSDPRSILVLGAVMVAGLGCPRNSVHIVICSGDTADYQFDAVSVSGPSAIPEGGSASYTVTWNATVRTAGGTVCPSGELVDDDGFLRFSGDLLENFSPLLGSTATVGPTTGSSVATLSCRDGQIIGTQGESGEGSRPAFFLPVDEAEVVAVVSRRDGSGSLRSAPIDVSCG